MNRVWLTPFSAPLESTRSPEVTATGGAEIVWTTSHHKTKPHTAAELNRLADGGSMSFFAMRRANGDWFAIDDNGHLRMLVFKSSRAAMIARSYDAGMECFRPEEFDVRAFEELKRTDRQAGSFLIVADPSRHPKHGIRLDFTGLASIMPDFPKVEQNSDNNHRNSKR